MATERVIILALVASGLLAMACAIPGTATFYIPSLPPACYDHPAQDTMIAAVNPALFNNGSACGRRYRIRCTGPINQGVPQPCRNGEITVTVLDLCPGCQDNQFDLSREAFSKIADPNAGRIQIDYNLA